MKNNCEKIFLIEIITVILQRDFWQKSINSLKKRWQRFDHHLPTSAKVRFFAKNRVERNFALFF